MHLDKDKIYSYYPHHFKIKSNTEFFVVGSRKVGERAKRFKILSTSRNLDIITGLASFFWGLDKQYSETRANQYITSIGHKPKKYQEWIKKAEEFVLLNV